MTDTKTEPKKARTTVKAGTVDELVKLVNNCALLPALKKIFDRSFVAVVDREGDQVMLMVAEQDSGSEFMTVADLAIILQTTRQKVRALTQARAQKFSDHPVPFFKINGKSLRFKRSSIMEWLGAIAAEKPVFAPAKGKGRK